MSNLKNLTHTPAINSGRSLNEVGERQRRRKIASLKEASKKALWFLDSFNLDVTSILLKIKGSEEVVTLQYSQQEECNPSHQSFAKIDEVLYLLDSFNVSDEFYHELSMLHPSLPRSYLIKSRRGLLSSNVQMHRLPRPYFGAYRYLEDCIIEVLSTMVSSITQYLLV